MNLQQLKTYCRQFPAASERLLPPPYNILVYSISEQNFAYFKTSEPEQWRFSVKVTPSQFVELTGLPVCKPARYRGRYHWITIVDVANFPEDYLRELVVGSYRYALAKVPKSRRPKASE
jgi:predicted DNA-binding protein (MmcQ/YjbR family)